jgi:hypothetical protein
MEAATDGALRRTRSMPSHPLPWPPGNLSRPAMRYWTPPPPGQQSQSPSWSPHGFSDSSMRVALIIAAALVGTAMGLLLLSYVLRVHQMVRLKPSHQKGTESHFLPFFPTHYRDLSATRSG